MKDHQHKDYALLVLSEISGTRASCFRQEKIVRVYLKNNIEVIVVDNSFIPAKIYQFTDITGFDKFREDIRAIKQSPPSIREGTVIKVMRWLKHKLLFDITHPLQWISFIMTRAKLARLKRLPLKYCVGSSPSVTTLVWARLLGKTFKADNILLDFRDEWAYHPWLPASHNRLKTRIEKWLMKPSSTCSVSGYISNNMEKRTGGKVYTVYNGPDINFKRSETVSLGNHEKLVITYTGSIPPGSVDVQGAKAMVEAVVNTYPNVLFRFIGACAVLKDIMPPVKGSIEYVEHMPLKDVRLRQQESGALLFMGADFPENGGIVSAKIFEYLQTKKPILPLFIHKNSDIHHIISSACNSCPSLFTPADITALLSKSFDDLPRLENEDFILGLNTSIEKFFLEGKV